MQAIFGFVTLALFVFTLVDVITRDQSQIKNLGKGTWIFIVIILPMIGSILWFTIGREYQERLGTAHLGSFGDVRREATPVPTSTEADLAAIEREIAFHEKRDRVRQLEAELKAKRAGGAGTGA